jgi:thioesterase domain-containing protein
LTLPLNILFENSTLKKLAAEIDRRLSGTFVACHGDDPSFAPIFFLGMAPTLARCIPDKRVYGIDLELEGQTKATMEDLALVVVKKMREIQPEGPYILGGYSAKSVVAYEAARQLLLHDQEVALLLLFDPLSIPTRRPRDGATSIVVPGRRTSRYYRSRVSFHITALLSCSPVQALHYLRERVNTILERIVSRLVMLASYNRVEELEIVVRAIEKYQPASFSGRVAFFFSEMTPSTETEMAFINWRRFVLGDFKIYSIPGNHKTMFEEPNIQLLSTYLRDCIDW